MIIISGRDPQPWIQALKNKDPELELQVYPDCTEPEKVEFALVWNHPKGIFQKFPSLKVIASMGAGVDHILSDPELPKNVKITRIVDPQLASDMAEFVLALVMNHLRNLSIHKAQEQSALWKPKAYLRISDVKVGILGLGILGKSVAEKLTSAGFKVLGWVKNRKPNVDFEIYSGNEELTEFLLKSNILVCLLPLTPETENILDKNLFEKLPKNAFVINVARGKHLVEEDLLEMLENGKLSGAALDVFREEPLPKNHPFWKQSNIHITPHIASVTKPSAVVPQVLENYERMKKGKDLMNLVNREKGY